MLPAKIPNLLVNGSSGIAVGIATKIPPHNMREVVQGLKALIKNPDISIRELMKHIPAPDFPTGGVILASEGLHDAYSTGKGTILVRAKMHTEDNSGSKKKSLIVVTELPYQTNKVGWWSNFLSSTERSMWRYLTRPLLLFTSRPVWLSKSRNLWTRGRSLASLTFGTNPTGQGCGSS